MYIPDHYKEHNAEAIIDLIRTHPFGSLVTVIEGRVEIVHIPFILNDDGKHLRGHMALANPFMQAVRDGVEATAIFRGPHSYISPQNYAEPSAHFPTWNYSIVHVSGPLRELNRTETVRFLSDLITINERTVSDVSDYRLNSGPMHLFEKFLEGVIAFEMPMERVQGAFKISQNKTSDDLVTQIRRLRDGSDVQRELAEYMIKVADAKRVQEEGGTDDD